MDPKPPHRLAEAVGETPGLWIFVPISDALMRDAVKGDAVIAMAGEYAKDTAESMVRDRRFKLLKDREEEKYG